MEVNWLDILILIICIAALVRGFFTGFIMQIATLAGIILGIIFAGEIASLISPYIEGWMEDAKQFVAPVSYLISFILILIIVTLIGRLVNYLAKAVLLDTANKMAGAVFCMGKWILIISILINLVAIFDSNKNILTEKTRNSSYSYAALIEIANIISPYLQLGDTELPSLPTDTDSSPQSVIL